MLHILFFCCNAWYNVHIFLYKIYIFMAFILILSNPLYVCVSLQKAESRNSRGSVDREDGTLQAPVSLCVRVYVCVCFDILKLDSLVVSLSCGAWLDKCLWC